MNQSIHLKILVFSPRHSTGISPHSEAGENTESDWESLLRPDGAWDAGASKDNTGQKSQLNAVGLLVGDPVGAQRVQGADGAAGGHRGNATGAHVAGDSAACRQGSEKVADLDERLLIVGLVLVLGGFRRLILWLLCSMHVVVDVVGEEGNDSLP